MAGIVMFLYGVVAYGVFLGTFLYAVGFVGNLVVPTGLDAAPVGSLGTSLLIDLGLLALFAVQHSVMARPAFKQAWTRIVPQPVERSTYVLASSLALILLFWQWRPLGGVVWDIQAPAGRALMHAGFVFGWLLVFVTTFLINHFDLFGLRQVWLRLRGRAFEPLRFTTPGPYRLVRHPLYVGWLFAFWATPTMTAAHLLFAVATTAYILVAIQLEERDLVQAHPEYADYRRRVPMLVPGLRRGGEAAGARRWADRFAALGLVLAIALAPAAHAARIIDGDDTGGDTGGDTGDGPGGDAPVNPCLENVGGGLRVDPSTIVLGQTTTVTWKAGIPAGCPTMKIYLNGAVVPTAGFRTLQPEVNSLQKLYAVMNGIGSTPIATVALTVLMPPDPEHPGRNLVDITSDAQVPLFLQALATPNTTVNVANDVQLDLSGLEFIPLAGGVILRGGRGGLELGPRLFTTTRPAALFLVAGDGVQITGVRIDGPDWNVVERHTNRGIHVVSKRKVRIDHNAIGGFSGMGIQVWDPEGVMHPGGQVQVHIHDNYIHHNQAVGGDGYGVAVGAGAYVLIEHNVFEWNRHAIEGDGSPGTGYVATGNLVLEEGGYHRWITFPVGFWRRTHQFDMHGMYDCGVWSAFSDALGNCGPAGHSMFIRQNTFFYSADDAIKLRGTPEVGMFVGENVFAGHGSFDDATSQEETGLVEEPGNIYGYNGKAQLGTCDFDADGVNDTFMATGVTWWYSSGGARPWTYLNTSPVRLQDLQLGNFDFDPRCDVKVGNTVFSGGRSGSIGLGGLGGPSGGVLAQ